MKKTILLLSIIVYTLPTQAMKRPRPYEDDLPLKKIKTHNAKDDKQINTPDFFLDMLPTELQDVVIKFAIISTADGMKERSPRDGIKTHKKFILVNKQFNATFKTEMLKLSVSDQLIHAFAFRYLCSHESIAQFFDTPLARDRLALQSELRTLLFSTKDATILEKELDDLIAQGVDLEFSYNKNSLQKTPLMISARFNPTLFNLLLAKGAHINGTNSGGKTVLMSILEDDRNYSCFDTLLNHSETALNQQNKKGETALLYTLRVLLNRKNRQWISPDHINAIRKLIDHPQINLTLRDNRGNTSYSTAKKLEDWRIIVNIQVAQRYRLPTRQI